jgi:hypothetical protein
MLSTLGNLETYINEQDLSTGETPLQAAMRVGNQQAVDLLKSYGPATDSTLFEPPSIEFGEGPEEVKLIEDQGGDLEEPEERPIKRRRVLIESEHVVDDGSFEGRTETQPVLFENPKKQLKRAKEKARRKSLSRGMERLAELTRPGKKEGYRRHEKVVWDAVAMIVKLLDEKTPSVVAPSSSKL